ncbi:hypothetical protein, partial [Saccharothrix sp. ST-888]|uniref:hypothetical protein n=1 Tax=Saccharothrix sp. ST-888 TaxID=1427391 RepID=UPI0005EC811D
PGHRGEGAGPGRPVVAAGGAAAQPVLSGLGAAGRALLAPGIAGLGRDGRPAIARHRLYHAELGVVAEHVGGFTASRPRAVG